MPQGGFPPPRQRRRSPAPLLIVIAVAALGLVGLLAFAAGGVGTDIVGPNYQNEDYQVPEATENQPPLPEPTTEEEMTQWLENNAWYAESLPEPVRCELPGSELPSGADNDTLQERMTELINCLTRTVGPSLEDAGLVAIQPRVTIYGPGAEITTQCGTASSHNAFYCPLDQALYLSPDIPQLLPSSEASAPYLFDFIMAHEYAHAMQGRSGILVASLIAQYLAETDAEAAELGRRIELQADCIATTMLTSVRNDMEISPEDFTTLSQVAMEIGDDSLADRFNIEYVADESSHGTGENRQMWSLRGADQHAVGACNTFTASSDEVR